MIKHFGVLARSILFQIFNLSWIFGKLPTIWKMSIIVSVLKPGKDAASCKNFRPISLTSTLCKIMEKIIHSRIVKWLIKRKVLHIYQTAYRAQHNTVDRLFYLVLSIIDGFQERPHRKTSAVFIDLSAAFDRVWRQKLIEILHSLCISGNILLWINDFLRDRRFAVSVNGRFSRTHRSWAGIPQGSVLSPLLFLLYMNTVDNHIVNEAKIECYADDTTIWHSHTDIIIS
ncbi:probable RNA-directed DNA polymerase from transposon BS [Trichonephila clavata]|uniref:Probable RNA-directed DNA polymerase from transposon BS n=1 Tax=Trichonephila clavata TaxID=2740835 RepID=A0A8X6KPU3_TRICU|nr:probable RNA-directed DNA polymerase from transposon BS [Trichonephila clavata]